MEKSLVTSNRVFVVGVGMTKFYRPGKHSNDYPELANQAMRRALRDSNVNFNKM